MTLPVLYSFRRCPYAMRARLAIAHSGIAVELREIVLRAKPEAMLALSPKGTVPVLQLPDGQVLEESLDIMRWAIEEAGNSDLIPDALQEAIDSLIERNDNEFKPWLDRYKYADRYPEHSETYYRDQCESWFAELEALLSANNGGLLGKELTLADYALLPFVRQCAHVDLAWFESTDYPALQHWLAQLKSSELFQGIMTKYPAWEAGQASVIFQASDN